MLETILAIVGGALALLFGVGQFNAHRNIKRMEQERDARRQASEKQQEAAYQAALKIKDDLAKRPPIDTQKRSDFE